MQGPLEDLFTLSRIAKLTGLTARTGREGGRALPEASTTREVRFLAKSQSIWGI